ncbi:hypothetical protein SS50377_24732 [Spironucleus salmonicida]|nr:hypothetical protein SS50377_24732 [Spironucleus salmonicida]
MEIQPLTSYKFIIYVKIQRQTNDNDNVTIQYDNDSQLKFPKLLKINITTASVTQQQIKNIFYQMDYESLQKEQILLQNQLRSIKKQIFEIESQGTFLFIRRKDLEKSVSNIEIHLGINLKDWKQRVRKVIKSSQNAAFVATAYIVGFILALKW